MFTRNYYLYEFEYEIDPICVFNVFIPNLMSSLAKEQTLNAAQKKLIMCAMKPEQIVGRVKMRHVIHLENNVEENVSQAT